MSGDSRQKLTGFDHLALEQVNLIDQKIWFDEGEGMSEA